MNLRKLLKNVSYELVQGNENIDISDIVYDSRKVVDNCLFVALVGYNTDGHKYAEEAVNKGAVCLVVEKDVNVGKDVTVIKVKNSRQVLAIISANYFGNPTDKIVTIGVTGTKGKTTTTFMIRDIVKASGKKIGLMGTNGVFYDDIYVALDNTTPESYEVQKYIRQMVDAGMEYMVMEVSSQALKFNRCDGFVFDYGVFTNLTHDHISDFEHPNLEDYIHSKSLLFQRCKHGVFNVDDDNYDEMVKNATCDVYTYGYNKSANIWIKKVDLVRENKAIGIDMWLSNDIDDIVRVNTPGKFSSYNAACAISVCHLLGIDISKMKEVLKVFSVKGRVEPVNIKDGVTFIIDYAHNGVAMESILTTMREYNPKRLITIFGCGGNRSKERRYEMGDVSGRLADFSIVTSDNPRFEEPQAIIDDILSTIVKTGGKYVTIIDRREAIKYAIDNAKVGDIILLLGKGHEDYQEIEGVKHHFDDKEEVIKILESSKN